MAQSPNVNKNFSQFPLLWLAACFGVGIFAARLVEVPIYGWLGALIFAVMGICLQFHRQKYSAATICLCLAFVIGGAMLFEIENDDVAANRVCRIYDAGKIDFRTPVELVGVLQNEPEQTPNGQFLTLETTRIKFNQHEQTASGAVRLFLPLRNQSAFDASQQLDLHYGATVKIAATITREDRFRNPGYTPYRTLLAQKNLDAGGTVESLQKLADAPDFSPFGWIYRRRAELVESFRRNFSPETTGVLTASLLNNRYFLDKNTAAHFREGGTFHVLVISGAHITFIGLLIIWLVGKITRRVLVQFVLANSLLWLFTVAVGAEAPVTRAAVMFTIFHAATLFYRESVSLNALGATVLLLLMWRPTNLFDQSLQLTFVSVFAIIGVAFPILEKMRAIGAWQLAEKNPVPPDCSKWFKAFCEILFWNENDWRLTQSRSIWKAQLFKSSFAKRFTASLAQRIGRFVFAAIFVSIVVTVWLLPLMAFYFHRLSFAAIFLNIFVGALIAVETFAAVFAASIAGFSRTLAAPFISWTEICNYWLTYSSEPFIQTGFASIRLPVYSGAAMIIYWIYYVPLILIAAVVYRWNPFQLSAERSAKKKTSNAVLITAACLLTAVIIFHPLSAPVADRRLHIDFLDVGQGDAALITTPAGTRILVDGGGKIEFAANIAQPNGGKQVFVPDARSIGEAVVCEYLWANGIDRIDYLMPTHADADHINGLNDVARNFRVQAVVVGRSPLNNKEYAGFAEVLNKRGIPISTIKRGDVWEIDGVKFEFLAPEFNADPAAASDNNHSIVFRLSYGAKSFLFTGDIEAATERFLMQQPENLASDVVKVAHHGSKTSSTINFVQATHAKFAVISVGRDSPYGHPHTQTLENWTRSNAQILTTGENGTLSFSTDGIDLQINSFVGSH